MLACLLRWEGVGHAHVSPLLGGLLALECLLRLEGLAMLSCLLRWEGLAMYTCFLRWEGVDEGES